MALCDRDAAGMRLAPLFGDHAVIQRGKTTPVWGCNAQPRAKLACRIGGATSWTVANPDGTFLFYLPPMEAGGPYDLTVANETRTGSAPLAEVFTASHDVYVGEVWLCSGQSNMALEMRRAKPGFGDEPVEKLRVFAVPAGCRAGRPAADVDATWDVATPESAQGKSAVAAFFGRELQRELGCAVGVVVAAVGGTIAMNWTSRDGLLATPEGRRIVEKYERGLSNPATWADPPSANTGADVADDGISAEAAGWALPEADTTDWTVADAPCDFAAAFGHAFNGAAWFRKDIDIPAEWEGHALTLALPAIDKHDIAFFNGVEVGRTGKGFEWEAWDKPRTYAVPAGLVKAGRATIAIRIWSYKLGAGFSTGVDHFSIGPADGTDATALEGDWRTKVERDIGNRTESLPPVRHPGGRSIGVPHGLYDGMIAPLVPFALRGAVWYQGESEADAMDDARRHKALLAGMINDWRRKWGEEKMPFCIVQIANFGPLRTYEKSSPWSVVRFAQLQLSLEMEGVGMVSAIDVGEATNLHPADKLTVGKRLANWAMASVYGDTGRTATGPRFVSAVADGCKITVRFADAAHGLATRDGAPVGALRLAGEDGVFHAAEGEILGDSLAVSSAEVPSPRAVQYAWAKNPAAANLVNAEGFPASPFSWAKSQTQPGQGA